MLECNVLGEARALLACRVQACALGYVTSRVESTLGYIHVEQWMH